VTTVNASVFTNRMSVSFSADGNRYRAVSRTEADREKMKMKSDEWRAFWRNCWRHVS